MTADAELLAILRRAKTAGIEPLRIVIALNQDPAILQLLNDQASDTPSQP